MISSELLSDRCLAWMARLGRAGFPMRPARVARISYARSAGRAITRASRATSSEVNWTFPFRLDHSFNFWSSSPTKQFDRVPDYSLARSAVKALM